MSLSLFQTGRRLSVLYNKENLRWKHVALLHLEIQGQQWRHTKMMGKWISAMVERTFCRAKALTKERPVYCRPQEEMKFPFVLTSLSSKTKPSNQQTKTKSVQFSLLLEKHEYVILISSTVGWCPQTMMKGPELRASHPRDAAIWGPHLCYLPGFL